MVEKSKVTTNTSFKRFSYTYCHCLSVEIIGKVSFPAPKWNFCRPKGKNRHFAQFSSTNLIDSFASLRVNTEMPILNINLVFDWIFVFKLYFFGFWGIFQFRTCFSTHICIYVRVYWHATLIFLKRLEDCWCFFFCSNLFN
jgi:hypothetical protein